MPAGPSFNLCVPPFLFHFSFFCPFSYFNFIWLLENIPALNKYSCWVGHWDTQICCILCLQEPLLLLEWWNSPPRRQPWHLTRSSQALCAGADGARPECADVWTVGACQFHRRCSLPALADLFLHGMLFSFHRHTAVGLSSSLGNQVLIAFPWFSFTVIWDTLAFPVQELFYQWCHLSFERLNFVARWKCSLWRISENSIITLGLRQNLKMLLTFYVRGGIFFRERRRVSGIPVCHIQPQSFDYLRLLP